MKITCTQVSISIHKFSLAHSHICLLMCCLWLLFHQSCRVEQHPSSNRIDPISLSKDNSLSNPLFLFIHLYIRLLDTIPSVRLLFFIQLYIMAILSFPRSTNFLIGISSSVMHSRAFLPLLAYLPY